MFDADRLAVEITTTLPVFREDVRAKIDGRNVVIYVNGAQVASVNRAQQSFADDNSKMLDAARNAGIRSVGYANKPGKHQRLRDAGAHAVVDDMRAIAQATWRHLLFGVVLGELERRLNGPEDVEVPPFDQVVSTNGHGDLEAALSGVSPS